MSRSRPVLIIELYRSLFASNTFLRYLEKVGSGAESYAFFRRERKRFISKKAYIVREALCLFKLSVTFNRLRNRHVLCLGGHYATLFWCKIFGCLLGREFRLYLYNFYIHQAGKNKYVQHVLGFLLRNKRCTLIVQSPREVDYYRDLTDMAIHFVPYCADPYTAPPSGGVELPVGPYVFSGGYTNRDYAGVLRCAAQLPDTHFVLAMSQLNRETESIPPPGNVTVYRNIGRGDFEQLLRHATVVLLPLKEEVGASGQMLCLSAMQHAKAIVYSDLSAINYYLQPDAGLPYPAGDVDAMQRTLEQLMADPEQQQLIGTRAYRNYCDRYTTQARDRQLHAIITADNAPTQ